MRLGLVEGGHTGVAFPPSHDGSGAGRQGAVRDRVRAGRGSSSPSFPFDWGGSLAAYPEPGKRQEMRIPGGVPAFASFRGSLAWAEARALPPGEPLGPFPAATPVPYGRAQAPRPRTSRPRVPAARPAWRSGPRALLAAAVRGNAQNYSS